MDNLSKFLEKDKEAARQKLDYERWKREDWPSELEAWLNAIKEFYMLIASFVQDESTQGLLICSTPPLLVCTDPTEYYTMYLTLTTPLGQRIIMEPWGYRIVGTRGSIRMTRENKKPHYTFHRDVTTLEWRLKDGLLTKEIFRDCLWELLK